MIKINLFNKYREKCKLNIGIKKLKLNKYRKVSLFKKINKKKKADGFYMK